MRDDKPDVCCINGEDEKKCVSRQSQKDLAADPEFVAAWAEARERQKTASPPCKNKEPLCNFWRDTGECDKNPGYMLTNCRISCTECWKSPTA
jgi:hypothetical protein